MNYTLSFFLASGKRVDLTQISAEVAQNILNSIPTSKLISLPNAVLNTEHLEYVQATPEQPIPATVTDEKEGGE